MAFLKDKQINQLKQFIVDSEFFEKDSVITIEDNTYGANLLASPRIHIVEKSTSIEHWLNFQVLDIHDDLCLFNQAYYQNAKGGSQYYTILTDKYKMGWEFLIDIMSKYAEIANFEKVFYCATTFQKELTKFLAKKWKLNKELKFKSRRTNNVTNCFTFAPKQEKK